MLLLLFFAFSLHGADIHCENPESRDLATWKSCRSLKYLNMGRLDLTGSVKEDLGCYRCTFTRLYFKGGPYALRFRESRLIGAKCENANMNGIQMQGIKAQGFEARDCGFEKADFTTAFLQDAKFYGGSFRDAIFAGADLSGAEFENTDLRGADLSQTLLSRTRFRNVKTDASTKIPEGFHWPQ